MKVFTIFELRERTFKRINNYKETFECIGVYKLEEVAMNKFMENLKEQCSLILLKESGKSIYGFDDEDDKEKHSWVAYVKEEDDMQLGEVFYNDEWQYTLYLKEMEMK